MLVDVTFDGVSLAKGANARPDGNHGWFVEVEQPMPVGTLLALSGETQAMVKVERVVEGVGAGMVLIPTAPVEKSKADAKAESKPDAKAEAKQDAKAPDGDDEPDGNGAPKGSNGAPNGRRKKRKTNPGIA